MIPRTQKRTKIGAVTIELAVTLPVLVLLLLGTVDAGHYANAYQNVSDASREAARFAARASTSSSSEVNARAITYLTATFNNADLSGVTVNVTDEDGQILSSLASVPPGAPVQVEVVLPYEAVRILPGLPQLSNQNLRATCIMSRQ